MTGKWVIQALVQRGIFFALRRLDRNCFYQFRSQGFLKMADDRAGSVRDVCLEVLCQAMNDFCVVID